MPVPNDPSPEFKDYAHPERLVSASMYPVRSALTGARNSTIP